MNFLTKEQMEKLTTKRLLAYKNKLMQVPETSNWDDQSVFDRISKIHPEWNKTYHALKEILSKRENVK